MNGGIMRVIIILLQVATAMVACTFVSAPLTFVSARMVSLSSANPTDYIALLDGFLMRVAIVGLVCTVLHSFVLYFDFSFM